MSNNRYDEEDDSQQFEEEYEVEEEGQPVDEQDEQQIEEQEEEQPASYEDGADGDEATGYEDTGEEGEPFSYEEAGDEDQEGYEEQYQVGDAQEESAVTNVDPNVTIDLSHDELHQGGTMFSKKLLAALFSGHDDQPEVPVHAIDHAPIEQSPQGDWTVVEMLTQDAYGEAIYLQAKMDSGADANFMSFEMYSVIGIELTPIEGPQTFTTGTGAGATPIGTVDLSYTAGLQPQRFTETFQVLEGLPHDAVLGKDLMMKAHMIMVDPNYAHPPQSNSLCLLELPPKDPASKERALAFQQQRAAERAAAYQAKLAAGG